MRIIDYYLSNLKILLIIDEKYKVCKINRKKTPIKMFDVLNTISNTINIYFSLSLLSKLILQKMVKKRSGYIFFVCAIFVQAFTILLEYIIFSYFKT